MASISQSSSNNKSMWLYPKLIGFNPPQRWGHSSCYSNGFLYVFGGCCGGLHFGDVLALNLETMIWHNLMTTGHSPGPRDSHSAVLVGHMMIIFGGTNGSNKVNDLHILDLRSREWTRPNLRGVPPSPRESHTATLVGEDKLVIFGGSGEGGSNYLNDLHVLDLKTMWWTSPEVKGEIPVPRDSHSAVAIATKIFVYGGDCGDRYQGDIDMLDFDTMTWSRLYVQGPSPGVRAGHAAVNVGTKVYIIGGIGDKQYYNDVWILDTRAYSWTRLEVCGQKPQGRFSHTAIIADLDIAIYGGCGEDERPLNQLLLLKLGAEHPNGRYNVPMCKILGSHYNLKRRLVQEINKNSKNTCLSETLSIERRESGDHATELKPILHICSDNLHRKRRVANIKTIEIESEPEEHSLSLSQHSSPSHSTDQDQTPLKKAPSSVHKPVQILANIFKKSQSPVSRNWCSRNGGLESQVNLSRRKSQDLCILGEQPSRPIPEQNLIGADIRGKVDGAFDSGYLMTANVNGRIFRGVLFAPEPEVVYGGSIVGSNGWSSGIAPPNPRLNPWQRKSNASEAGEESWQSGRRASLSSQDPKITSELQGVVLTLGGPGHHQDPSPP